MTATSALLVVVAVLVMAVQGQTVVMSTCGIDEGAYGVTPWSLQVMLLRPLLLRVGLLDNTLFLPPSAKTLLLLSQTSSLSLCSCGGQGCSRCCRGTCGS
jgi:hypothetical protein